MTAQPVGRPIRNLTSAMLLGIAFLLASPIAGQARDLARGSSLGARTHVLASSPVTLHVSVGYQGIYRGSTWTPIRVTLDNSTSADIRGTLQIPQSGLAPSVGASPMFHGLYQTSILLPAGATKRVTLYLPGSGIQGQVNVNFSQGGKSLADVTAYPTGIDTSALLIGVMTGRPADAAWLAQGIQQQVTTHVLRLTPATFDPVPQALATFDIIVLTDVDTSQLDRTQLDALERYVTGGGSLLVVGGPDWQQTLRPLPAALLPGHLAGLRALRDLHGLLPLGPVTRPRGSQAAAVSVLSHSSGTIVASQVGIPLVVRKMTGQGAIEYLAFDPSLNPVQRWKGGSQLLGHLVAAAAPLAISRTWSPQGFRSRFRSAFSSAALTGELANLPPATLPLLALFAALTLVYVLILGPANFLILRWFNRQHLAWLTMPVLAVSYLGSAFGLTMVLKGHAVVLNSVGLIVLDGRAGLHPATFYVGLVAPLPGDYHLVYNDAALPAPLPQVNTANGFFSRSASTLHSTPLGVRLQEGNKTEVTFPAMKRWSMRDVTLNTRVRIPGTVRSNLAIDARGDIAGTVSNGTNLDLLEPVVLAGQSIAHLPPIPSGTTVRVHVRPVSDGSGQDSSALWAQLYGGPDLGNVEGFGGPRGCCDQFSFTQENNLIDRVRNATGMLSQSQTLSTFGNVLLIGWSKQSLGGSFIVDASAPQRRDLNLVVMPLPVHFPSHGSFQLRTGTLQAHLIDIVPRAPQSSCCSFFSQNVQQLSVGPGGSVTFEFETPRNGRVRFQHLMVTVNSGDSGTIIGYLYDRHAQRWVAIDLSSGSAQPSRPDRFVSADGRIMLKIQATAGSGDLTIDDPYKDVQLSGTGAVT